MQNTSEIRPKLAMITKIANERLKTIENLKHQNKILEAMYSDKERECKRLKKQRGSNRLENLLIVVTVAFILILIPYLIFR